MLCISIFFSSHKCKTKQIGLVGFFKDKICFPYLNIYNLDLNLLYNQWCETDNLSNLSV